MKLIISHLHCTCTLIGSSYIKLTKDTKKCILSGDFILLTILPLNGPKHFPSTMSMCAISPALRSSGGR